jgi:SSS family solute:Na+ symporter
LPFIDRVGLVFLLCILLGVLVSRHKPDADRDNAIDYSTVDHSTSRGFNLGSVVIILMLTALYISWW